MASDSIRRFTSDDPDMDFEPCAECGAPLGTIGDEDEATFYVHEDYDAAFCSRSCAHKYAAARFTLAELARPYSDLA